MRLGKHVPADIHEATDEEVLAYSIEAPDAFAIIVERYEAAFLRKVMGILKQREPAEDVVQEAFTKIYMHAPRFKKVEGARFSSWAYKIVINTALTRYRKRSRRWQHTAPVEPEFYETLPDTGTNIVEENMLADTVASVLSRMPDHFARVLQLHFLEGKSHREIAESEDMTEGAVKTRVYRAKQAFRDISKSIEVI